MAFCEKCKKKIDDKYSLCDDCLCDEVNDLFAEENDVKSEETSEKTERLFDYDVK